MSSLWYLRKIQRLKSHSFNVKLSPWIYQVLNCIESHEILLLKTNIILVFHSYTDISILDKPSQTGVDFQNSSKNIHFCWTSFLYGFRWKQGRLSKIAKVHQTNICKWLRQIFVSTTYHVIHYLKWNILAFSREWSRHGNVWHECEGRV